MTDAPRRRGRPRKHPAKIDPGTPELQRHRAILAGSADPTLSEDPLAMMVARGLLQPTEAQAGRYYAALYRRAVGRPHLSLNAHYRRLAMNAPAMPGEDDEAGVAEARRLYLLGKQRLVEAGHKVAEATEDLVIFGMRPRFLLPRAAVESRSRGWAAANEPADAHYRAIRAGLETLAAGYGFQGAERR